MKKSDEIRDAEMKKIPFMLIVGEKEMEEGAVSVRRHGQGDVGNMKITEFITHINTVIQQEIEA